MKMQVLLLASILAHLITISGCVSTGGTASETHRRGMTAISENEYVIAKQPIDRHFIGAAWSRQYGPVEEPGAAEIRTKKDRSFNGVQQNFAFNAGIALGATPVSIPVQGEIGIQGGSIEKAKMEGLEIIRPVSIADIPFEPEYNYVTEALRLSNFKIQDEKSNKGGINFAVGSNVGTGTAITEIGSQSKRGTEGQGLVVAYKLQTIDKETLQNKDSGMVPIILDKSQDFPNSGIIVKARLQTVELGSGKSLPRSVVWACPKADAQSKNIIAAWMVDIKPLDLKRKPLTVAFPAYPKIEQCQQFGSTIFARIDPLTDRIIRQRVNLMIVDAEINEQMSPTVFDGRISLSDESFKIRTVTPEEVK